MTIVDALSKAKRLAEQKRSARPQPESAPTVGRGVAEPAFNPLPVVPALVPSKVIQPVHIELDTTVCIKNRLLVPGSQNVLDRKAESAFRMLRTRVLQRARAQGWTTIGITSACANDGKTLTSLNLALSLAREKNSSIFVIDLDMRNPSVCNAMGIIPSTHVRDYFEGNVPADALFIDIGIENLMLVGGSLTSERSSELLSTPKFEELVDHIKSAAVQPLIIVDLPPVVTTDDALVLAPRLDAILLVTSEGRTEREQVVRAVDLLSEFRLAGYVLNRSQQAIQSYYGNY